MEEYYERKQVGKVWGFEDWIINSPMYCGKILRMHEGWESSLHYHPKKHETMVCIHGKILVELYPEGNVDARIPTYTIMTGEDRTRIVLPPNTKHRFSTPFGESGEMIEFSTTHDDEDVVRLAVSHPLEKLDV
jgi:mannose-6-phosphate isomerase-like protein (cupin superfamily)